VWARGHDDYAAGFPGPVDFHGLDIHVQILRKPRRGIIQVQQEEVSVLSGHAETHTRLAISLNGSYLLSPSFLSQAIIHDILAICALGEPCKSRVEWCTCQLREHLPQRPGRLESRGWWSPRCSRADCMGRGKLQDLVQGIFLYGTRHDACFVAVIV
jgi:hypothetical protein